MNVKNEEEFNKQLPRLQATNAELATANKKLSDANFELDKAYTELYSLDYDSYISDLLVDRDYRNQFVKRINEEITKEKAEVAEAKGTEDEDVRTAEGEAVVAWFNERLAEQKEFQKQAQAIWSRENENSEF